MCMWSVGCGVGGEWTDRNGGGGTLEPFLLNCPEDSPETLAKWSISSSSRTDMFILFATFGIRVKAKKGNMR